LITLVLIGVSGGLWNRIRGAGISGGKIANAAAFGIMAAAAAGPGTGAVASVFMALGQAPGWGRYIGAMGGWETKELEEWYAIDWIIRPLRAWPRVWGGAGLALRGAFWGWMLGFVLGTPWPILAGLMMPVFYGIGLLASHALRMDNPDGAGWELGEYLFGSALWALSIGPLVTR